MHMALNAEEWIRLNTSYCNRLSAWLSPKSCEANRVRSASGEGDLRCSGCNGLNDQEQVSSTLNRSLHLALVEVLTADDSTAEDEGKPEELAPLYERGCFDLDELELDELLAGLFELGQEEMREECRPVYLEDSPEKPRRVPVFTGRCSRCNGYMVNDQERQSNERDEHVYRCFTCGYRTSPIYKDNRALRARGLEV